MLGKRTFSQLYPEDEITFVDGTTGEELCYDIVLPEEPPAAKVAKIDSPGSTQIVRYDSLHSLFKKRIEELEKLIPELRRENKHLQEEAADMFGAFNKMYDRFVSSNDQVLKLQEKNKHLKDCLDAALSLL